VLFKWLSYEVHILEKASYALASSISSERGTVVSFPFTKRDILGLVVLLVAALAVRVLLFPLQGYPIDTNDFISWFNTAATQGIRPFYSVAGFADYPPFNVYIFWFFGSIANGLGVGIANIIKWVPTLFDLATSALIFFFVRRQLTFNQSLIATSLYAFNPAIIFNVAVWGQFDAVYTFFLVLAVLLALKRKPEASAVVFAVGLLTKPQGIALLPLIVLLIFMHSGVKRLLTSIGTFAATVFLVILPFEWTNPITFLTNIYFGAYGGYQYTSINAFNLWGLFGLWIPDGNLYLVGWALFGAFAAFTLYVLYRRFHVSGDLLAIFAAFLLFFEFFMLPTRIHERYLFPAISMLVLLVPFAKKIRYLYVALTATLFVNEAYVLYWLNASYPGAPPNLSGDPVVLAVSVINLVMFLYATLLLWTELKGRQLFQATKPERGDVPK
jgi:dolichyl-phosphate-mannose-protein mannosyltransferase